MNTVLAATAWNTNADMIEACAELGYLKKEWLTLDPTYGKGNWWTKWRPDQLVTHDLAIDGVNFKALPYPDGGWPNSTDGFDAVVFDPPYVSPGGRSTTSIPDFHAAYGLTETPRTPRLLWEDNTLGFAECVRVTKPKGFILYKSQDYITSGKFQPVTHWLLEDAHTRPLEYVDRLEHIAGVRPQPNGRRQMHARRNLSTLFVFKKRSR